MRDHLWFRRTVPQRFKRTSKKYLPIRCMYLLDNILLTMKLILLAVIFLSNNYLKGRLNVIVPLHSI